jgi:hypothetical protein
VLAEGGPLYLPVSRYFAKLLGCQLADAGAPIPRRLSRFVAKRTTRNCIWWDIRSDATYREIEPQVPILKYAAHGGLIVIVKGPELWPSRIHTTQSVGPVQFVISLTLSRWEQLALRWQHPGFVQRSQVAARQAIADPIPDATLAKLGLDRKG